MDYIKSGNGRKEGDIMKRNEMVCRKCIKAAKDGTECRSTSIPNMILEPDTFWCAEGEWHQWSERHKEMEPYLWGEWDDEEKTEPGN